MNAEDVAKLFEIARNFGDGCEPVGVEPFGNGHIHDTWCATLDDGTRMVIQRVNEAVFPSPEAIMHNLDAISEHFANTTSTSPIPPVLRGKNGEPAMRLACGFYRAFPCIENTVCHERVPDPETAGSAARAFARFLRRLRNYQGPELQPAIVGFHHMPTYLDKLDTAVAEDAHGRVAESADLLDAIAQRRDLIEAFTAASLPQRIIHGDTKINNILFDKDTGHASCVIDLDTVMTGTPVLDFGDLVRTSVSPADEDERDLDKITVRLPILEALVEGYCGELSDILTPEEIEWLSHAGTLLALEMVIRFLADHLAGDVYFRVHHEGHNLQRARAQLRLVQELEAARPQITAIIERLNSASQVG